jgi:superfamily II DNA or RNA helicase
MFRFPDIDDDKLMTKIYKKKEFYDNKAPKPENPKSAKEQAEYVQSTCRPISFDIQPQQALLSNLIHPNTPYKGMLVYHGLGSGKTCAAFAVAENFKEQVLRYQTKIYIVVPGKDVRELWRNEMIEVCGKNTYLNTGNNGNISELHSQSQKKKALRKLKEVYKIVTYDKLRRMVIGEKTEDLQGEKVYRMDSQSLQKLDNSLIIVDEAHNIAGSERGKALHMLIQNSTNLRVLLLTATPMRNVAEDIVPLLNYLRPPDSQISKDDVFEHADKVLDMKLKPNGLEVLKQSARGYISYFKSANPLLFAKVNEMGTAVPGLDMKLYRCKISGLQEKGYKAFVVGNTKQLTSLDSLSKAQAFSNFVFPAIDEDNKLIGVSAHKGLMLFRSQMKQKPDKLKLLLQKELKVKSMTLNITVKHKIMGGDPLNMSHLKYFSSKYDHLLKNLTSMGPGTAFVYSNFVEIGIQIVEEILIENGYLEFGDSHITSKTRCSYCNKTQGEKHANHTFTPARFFTFTGQMVENEAERSTVIPQFNDPKNIDGSVIKFLLGSQVLSEGINLKSVRAVHIMDAHLNLSRLNQAVGRAVRYCSSVNLVSEDNPRPVVDVYKYAASYGKKLSLEEMIYRHAEIKFKLIGKINKMAQSVAIDCPLNYEANQVVCDGASELWDGKKYKDLSPKEIDKNTFHISLAEKEIRKMKNSIKSMFIKRLYYTLKEIRTELEITLKNEFFLYRALEDLTPITDEKKNAYNEIFVDNYNRLGYLIYRSGYYIFQQWLAEEYMPIYYRSRPPALPSQKTDLKNFLKMKNLLPEKSRKKSLNDFESNMTYYQQYLEGPYVGIIELGPGGSEIFKVRVRQMKSDFRRGKGIVSYRGAVCDKKSTAWLLEACDELKAKVTNRRNRQHICEQLRKRLEVLEATQPLTYLIMPSNHPQFPIKKLNK